MSLYYGTHPHLERGEMRADIILGEIVAGKSYPDSENVPLYKGWLGVLADHFMLAGVLRFLGKVNKDANVMISYNERDWEDQQEIVPD